MVLPNTATCEGVSTGKLHQKVALIEYDILPDVLFLFWRSVDVKCPTEVLSLCYLSIDDNTIIV